MRFGNKYFIQHLKAYCARSGQSADHLGKFVPGRLNDGGTGAQHLQDCHL